ncbi:tetratricopeptide repeat protein [Carboxylicivirga sp. N1Y90]|uniref:tetratricopeptide repeat protein n=1 Tax=Carboxylicivirga fragile TaxID=3417571 RepID=UPI003D355B01|nr:hypothetical protein [Marinilabiliaceae bacterium N1Y90]
MNKAQFFDLVSQPNKVDETTLSSLSEIVDEFPWFQSARMLRVKNLHVLDHVRFNSELKQTAAYIVDRQRLYDLVHQQELEPELEDAGSKELDVEPKDKKESVEATREEVVVSDKRSSSVGLTTNVRSVADYFQTDDVFETNDGVGVDFSKISAADKPEEDETEMVLPSADFLGYDSSDFTNYQLKEALDPEEIEEENRSFSGWLNVLRHAPIPKDEAEEKPVPKKSQQLIDNFLNVEAPRIVAKPVEKTKPESNDRHENSIQENDDLLSETLANIYIKQKHYDKAIGIYEKLRLKYPEKNVYFAERISDLEKLINNQ